MARTKKFKAVVVTDKKRRAVVAVPFDPDEVWGKKEKHYVAGTINDAKFRAVIEDGGIVIGKTWREECGLNPGDKVSVVVQAEGPQRDDLPDDVAAALAAAPEAGAFFDSLAQFYRRGYLRWIDATKRRPEERAVRIEEMVKLLKAGVKQRG